jgi:hypothetical protein
MKTYGGMDALTHIFLTSALAGSELSALRSGRFTPNVHWLGSCVDLKAGLGFMEKREFLILPGLELRPLGHAAHFQSL